MLQLEKVIPFKNDMMNFIISPTNMIYEKSKNYIELLNTTEDEDYLKSIVASNTKYFYLGLSSYFIVILIFEKLIFKIENINFLDFENCCSFICIIFFSFFTYSSLKKVEYINLLNYDENIQSLGKKNLVVNGFYNYMNTMIICISLCFLYKEIIGFSITIKNIIIFIVIIFFGFWRIVHFWCAFVKDIKKKLDGSDKKSKPKGSLSGSKKKRRLKLVCLSYLSLILDYSILYYFLSKCKGAFKGLDESNGILDSIYFSLSTITTLGYGDISPSVNFTKVFVMMEVLSGMFLIGVNLTIYMNENENQ